MITKCLKCGIEFKARTHGIRGVQKYCSIKCSPTVFKKDQVPHNLQNVYLNCIVCDKQFKTCKSGLWRKTCSKECWDKIHKPIFNTCIICNKQYQIKRYRKNTSKLCSYKCQWKYFSKCGKYNGENSHFWKGGITPINLQIRHSFEYKQWRRIIFERDDYTCQICKKRGVYLEVDHIKPFALFPEMRLNIDNGRTLCKECHKTTDTYLGRIFNKNRGDYI